MSRLIYILYAGNRNSIALFAITSAIMVLDLSLYLLLTFSSYINYFLAVLTSVDTYSPSNRWAYYIASIPFPTWSFVSKCYCWYWEDVLVVNQTQNSHPIERHSSFCFEFTLFAISLMELNIHIYDTFYIA